MSCRTFVPSSEAYLPKFESQYQLQSTDATSGTGKEFTYKIDLTNGTEWSHLTGHQVNGKITFPTSGHLYLVWNTFATHHNVRFYELPVVFEDVQFQSPIVLDRPVVEMCVRLYEPQYNRFEVVYNGKVVVSGRIHKSQETTEQNETNQTLKNYRKNELLVKEEIYRELKLRGYEYSGVFRGIVKASIDGTFGELTWSGKWVAFLETIIQMHVLSKPGLHYPSYIQRIHIDPRVHGECLTKAAEDVTRFSKRISTLNNRYNYEIQNTEVTVPVMYEEYTRTYISGGVEMSGFYSKQLPKTYLEQPVVLERYNFVPYFERSNVNERFYRQESEISPDFVDVYLNEVERYMNEVMRKIELTKLLAQQTSLANVRMNLKSTVFPPVEVDGKIVRGRFLDLLKEISSFQVDSQFLDRVKQIFGDSFSYYQSWNEDPIFHITSGRLTHLKTMLDTVLENITFDEQMPRVKVLEIGSQLNFFGPKIHQLIGMNPTAQVDYHYVPVGEFVPEFFYQWESKYPMTKVEWDLRSLEIPTKYFGFDLIIINGVLSYLPFGDDKKMLKSWLTKVSELMLKPQGFFLIHEYVQRFDILNKISQFEQMIFKQTGLYQPYRYQLEGEWKGLFDDILYPISLKHDSVLSTSCLYRKPYFPMLTREVREIEINITSVDSFNWVEQVKAALKNEQYDRVWLICENLPTSGLIGFLRCLKYETRGDRLRCVFVHNQLPTQDTWRNKFNSIKVGDLVMNVFKNGIWGSYRHLFDYQEIEMPFIQNQKYIEDAHVEWLQPGDLSTFNWVQSPEPYTTNNNEILIDVAYSGLNYRDHLIATGIVQPENLPSYSKYDEHVFGMEFSGCSNNKRFMGITPGFGLSTSLVADKRYLWEIPQQWSHEQAATIPFAYSQAYYALVVRGGLKRSESILVHSGATPYGQAAISIALSYDCKVFTTIGSEEERAVLMSIFPDGLTEDSFVFENDECFDRHILRHTQGKGVNVVINWFLNERFTPSFKSLATCGRFLEMSYFTEPTGVISTPFFGRNISFHSIFFDSLFETENSEWQRVYTLVEEGIKLGIVRPIKSITYTPQNIQTVFEKFVASKSLLKVLIQVWEPSQTSQQSLIEVLPKICFSPYHTHIITAGLSVFGLELAQWMVERGARKMLLVSFESVSNGYQQRKIDYLQNTYGAIISISNYNAKYERECHSLIRQALELSDEKKIGSVFHLETEYENDLVDEKEKNESIMQTKYSTAYNLDKCTRGMDCHFVVFSLISSGFGYPNSSVSGYINSSIEQLCELRRQSGHQAVAIQWGKIGEVDSVFGTLETEPLYDGTIPHKVHSTFKVLEYVLLRSEFNTIWTSYVPIKAVSGIQTTYTTYFQNEVYQKEETTTQQEEELKKLTRQFDGLLGTSQQQRREQMKLDCEYPKQQEYFRQVTLHNLRSRIQQIKPKINEQTTISNNYLMPKNMFVKLNDIEITPNMHPVFIIHPIEGHIDMLKDLSKYMKYPVYGIQYTVDALKCDSIEELAGFYHQKIESVFGMQTRYHLIGYSFGTTVAYEMAAKRSNRILSLTFLDGTFVYLDEFLKTRHLNQELPVIEAELLYRFITKFTNNVDYKQIIQQLVGLTSYEARVQYTIKYLIATVGINFDSFDLEQSCKSFVKRMLMSYRYKPTAALNCNVLLVRPAKSNLFSQVYGSDYGLGIWVNGEVKVKLVEGEQSEFLQTMNSIKIATLTNDYITQSYYC